MYIFPGKWNLVDCILAARVYICREQIDNFFEPINLNTHTGAEIWWSRDSDADSTSSDSSNENDDDEDDDMDMEMAAIDTNEMIGDGEVDSTLTADDLPDQSTEHEFNKYLLKRSSDTSLDNIDIAESELNTSSSKRTKTDYALAESSTIDESSECTTTDADTS